jgi:hypothetical protein
VTELHVEAPLEHWLVVGHPVVESAAAIQIGMNRDGFGRDFLSWKDLVHAEAVPEGCP